MPVLKTTSPAADRGNPKTRPSSTSPSSSTNWPVRASWFITPPGFIRDDLPASQRLCEEPRAEAVEGAEVGDLEAVAVHVQEQQPLVPKPAGTLVGVVDDELPAAPVGLHVEVRNARFDPHGVEPPHHGS